MRYQSWHAANNDIELPMHLNSDTLRQWKLLQRDVSMYVFIFIQTSTYVYIYIYIYTYIHTYYQ